MIRNKKKKIYIKVVRFLINLSITFLIKLKLRLKIRELFPLILDCNSSDYLVINQIFKQINIQSSSVIADIGSGKGKFILYILSKNYPFKKIIGIEKNDIDFHISQKYLKNFKKVNLYNVDILDLNNIKADIYYLFNPFDKNTLNQFIKNINKNMEDPIIIYNNCKYIDSFDESWDMKLLESKYTTKRIAIIKRRKYNDF